MFGAGGTIGSAFPVSVGWGLAAQKAGKGQVAVCFFGDSSAGRGTMHEGMNMAANWRLPIVWVCENNGMGQFVPIQDAYPLEDIASMAAAYGMPGVVVDGQDVVAVAEAVLAAVDRARKGKGPSMVECKCLRFRSHVEGAPDWIHGEVRSPEEVEKLKKRDPVVLFQKKLAQQEILTRQEIEKIDQEIDAEVEEMLKFCEESAYPEPSILDNALYAE
jgi:pyruvate dehydrogenase E1 component alpha subunit